ncbi:fam-m protein [Plasmodium malariae]|uniref:Fam-m protein n=1 Tax=Plasmodium malariae TaxID=5858 RepID=A0A1D3SM25_PLAMA|nr:fam-m protein [Plasmodium malariae]SCO92873.1 fam-m protein [Plasmodium malariae]
MEQNIKIILYVKIASFILSAWICYFNDYELTFNKYFGENYDVGRKIYTTNSRSLAKHKQEMCSNILGLKEDIPFSGENDNRKNKKSNRRSLNNASYYTEIIDYNNGMFDGKHFHFEKKWITKKDYDNIVERNRRICDIALQKTKFRSYGFGVTLFFLLFVVGVAYAILEGFKLFGSAGKVFAKLLFSNDTATKAGPYVFTVLFGLLIVILSIIIIIVIPRILKNNEKYEKIKLISE